MPRFDPLNPKKTNRDKTSEFIDSAENSNSYSEKVYGQKRRSFGVFTQMFIGQQKKSAVSLEIILEKLEPIWDTAIEPSLIAEFGARSTLYVIFYRGRNREQIIMEIWDPKYIEVKPSQVFIIEGITDSVTRYFPYDRSQAEIRVLTDWA
jgi:hypothetical protein